MKYFALSLVLTSVISAAEFRTGQAARAIIGQETFTRQKPGASATVLGSVGGLAVANDTLFVTDSSRVAAAPQNNRILGYNNVSGKVPDAAASIPLNSASVVRCPVCNAPADFVLGQPDFGKTDIGLANNRLRTPTGIATDGRVLAVADTDNNRVLIWNPVPASIDVPANVVVGQKDFNTGFVNFNGSVNSQTPTAQGLRGPQGVWIQNGKLFIADTQNHRVLVWNSIPTQNGQSADLVLGKPNFTTFVEPDITQAAVTATARSMLNPVSVTSDGTRLLVTDLGHNRVLVWNSIPTQNEQPADFALGQPDVDGTTGRNASDANNSRNVCRPTGTDDNGAPTFPPLCAATLSFPRFALSDGTRFYIADGGNDRILVYNQPPTQSGQPADAVLGQVSDTTTQDSSLLDPDLANVSSSNSLRTPSSLAWDGKNLYVADVYNRRVVLFSMGDELLPNTGAKNSASEDIFAVGTISFSADPKENDEVTVRIGDARDYKYKAAANQTIDNVITGLVEAINAGEGDPAVFATPNPIFSQIILTARKGGEVGNLIQYAVTVSDGAQIQAATGGSTLRGGGDAARMAPGSLMTLTGFHFTDVTAVAPGDTNDLPRTLGGVEVYVDGIQAPLLFVSPTQINTQLPYEVNDASSVSVWVRMQTPDGVRTTNAIGVPVVPENPGIFAQAGLDPRPAVAFHGSDFAIGAVSVDGTPTENDVVSVTIEDRSYSYTVKKDDTTAIVRDGLIQQINQDERVTAYAAGVFTRIVLQAKVPGPEGNGIPYSAKGSDTLILTPLTSGLCCAGAANVPISENSPAVPGEVVTVYASGLGLVQPAEAKNATVTGSKYFGPILNTPNTPLDAIAGGKTANVLFAGLKQGSVGVYEVKLLLNTDIPTNPQTQLTIAQGFFVSNIVTFPVVNSSDQQ